MAYCRWSDCDVYVYADVSGGWTTHVAGRRNIAGKPPAFDISSEEALKQSVKEYKKWSEQNQEYEDIGLPEDGASFNHDTPQECADNLRRLKDMGYDVPPDVIEELENEVVEDE